MLEETFVAPTHLIEGVSDMCQCQTPEHVIMSFSQISNGVDIQCLVSMFVLHRETIFELIMLQSLKP